MANQDQFFRALGVRVKALRKKRGFSQEDMLSFGFSTRHWQQVEAGRPITVTTLLRICEVFELPMAKLVRGWTQRASTRSWSRCSPPPSPPRLNHRRLMHW